MYKIFIDTNIILDFYRINNKEDILEISSELIKYKKCLISTEQSNDEFLRNREKTINEFIEILNKQINFSYPNNFIATLDDYEEYSKKINETNEYIQKMKKACEDLIKNIEKDSIYNIFLNISSNSFIRTDEIVDRAIKRKYIGNPPTSNKNTCCDEIIWETLIKNCHENLIIVTRDKTFKENYNFLSNEYKNKVSKELFVVDTISKALKIIGEIPSQQFENIEDDIILENEFIEYGSLQKNSNWTNIIYNSLISLGGEANLKEIYTKIMQVIESKYPEILNSNKNIEATIRGKIERYSSDSKLYNGKINLFRKIKRGRWGIRNFE